MAGYIAVTTHSRRLRHYARPADMQPRIGGGHYGEALCTKHIYTKVYDQVAVDIDVAEYGRRDVVIADLRECKRCAKAVAS